MAFDHAISSCYPLWSRKQRTPHGVWGADVFAVTWHGTILRDVGIQPLENKALSRGIIRKAAYILTEITVRKGQKITFY